MKPLSQIAAQLLALINSGEREDIEFKRTVPSPFKTAKEMTAMANTVGGNIFIGIDDEGTIAGVDGIAQERHLLMKAAREHCSPPLPLQIKTVVIDGKAVLWVVIQPSTQKYSVADLRGRALVYVRVKDKNLIASKKAAQRVQDGPSLRLSPADLDRHEKLLLTWLKKHQNITLREFSCQANISKRRASRILVKLENAAFIRSHDFDKQVFYTLNPGSVRT
jgi:predicted HTH transcriptional regulator